MRRRQIVLEMSLHMAQIWLESTSAARSFAQLVIGLERVTNPSIRRLALCKIMEDTHSRKHFSQAARRSMLVLDLVAIFSINAVCLDHKVATAISVLMSMSLQIFVLH